MTAFQTIFLIVLVEIMSFSGVAARRYSRSSRYRSYYSGSSSEEDNTVAIIVVCSILGFFAIITIALILRAKCCPYWSPKEAISDCTSGWKCCQKNETKMHISTVSPAGQLKEREKRKLALAPVKRHMSDLKIVMQTPKPVLLKRESKEIEKNIALYESNPMHYRNFMEPPPAYEYLDPPPETKKEDESDFLQNRQRISRISRTVSALRIEKVKEEAKKSQEKSIPEDRRLKRVHSAL